ncbi:MAG: 2Fe-2S iron-sulfur cluster binding domain-containing protein [Oligosphaeraceae bacterium]|nr:2Fe-2S iron-sulfur cluster binding domain-containing protein [Oligosphaeraceae bacterium]
MNDTQSLTVNGRSVEFSKERNLLEVIRKAGIDIPTFCYHSELSIYGACRLCLVEVEGKGVMASCSTAPAAGMVIHTDTQEIRQMRKISIELLLANHKVDCPTCSRSASCALQDIAQRLGVNTVRFKKLEKFQDLDLSSPSLERDPNKCVLCGDCVRVCKEIQGIGAIDFANRGCKSKVAPAFDADLATVECVNCGQCAAVCPTGAIVPKQERNRVWDALYDKSKTVVVQVAPAVRVALGESYGAAPGENVAGKLVAALKLMGFKHVYDTSFTADLTIFEEATELLGRIKEKGRLPMFTSCCPAWVKYAEIYYPELLGNLSSCRSPQAMLGSVAKKILPAQFGIKRDDLVVVSIMPCTAKKYEAQLPKYQSEGRPEVDIVITTTEVQQMINSCGIVFNELEPEAFDMPMGFATGGGVIFGTSGGVMEAALRFVAEKLENKPLASVDFKAVRGMDSVKSATVTLGGQELKVAVVHGLANAKKLILDLREGRAAYDFVEVMACPGGCISGGGQPVGVTNKIRASRQRGLYAADKAHQVQKPQDNYLVTDCYRKNLGGEPGAPEAHHLLHTAYQNRSQLFDAKIPVLRGSAAQRLQITVTICAKQENCPGQLLLGMIAAYVKEHGYQDRANIDAAFSSRPSGDGTICVTIGEQVVERTRFTNAQNTLEQLQNQSAFANITEAIDQGIADLTAK